MQPSMLESDSGDSDTGWYDAHAPMKIPSSDLEPAANCCSSSLFAGAKNVHISGGNFSIHRPERHGAERSETVGRSMKALSSRAESGAPYDAAAREDVPKCQENTRLAIIDGINHWAHSRELDASPFMWMYGPAGSGKTTIMQTVAETWDNDRSLVASFFFSRLSAGRPKDKRNFVATIAHQLSLRIPSLKQHIADALDDSSLLDKTLIKQTNALIIGPLNSLKPSEVGGRFVIMVDGLDECEGDTAQKDVLDVLHHFSTHIQHPFRFLIASRSLSHIQGYFSRRIIAERTQTMPLDNDYQSYADIEAFVLSQFKCIKEEHPSRNGLRPEWPLACDVNDVVCRSSGQFIYPSVIMKYISDHGRHPATSLQTVLDLQIGGDPTPYKELDALYTHVMSTIELENLPYVMDVLGCLILDYHEFPMAEIAQSRPSDRIDQLFSVPLGTTDALMSKLRPLLIERNVRNGWLTFAHASFIEYLCDLSRSGSFFASLPKIHGSLARRVLMLYSAHLKIHGRCGVNHCRAGQSSCWKIPIDKNSTPDGNDLLLSHTSSNVIWHCSEAEFTAELQQDILSFDFQTALKVIVGWIDGNGNVVFWRETVRWLNFTIWLEEQGLMSPKDMEHVRSSIQCGIQSVSSEITTNTAARLIGICLADGNPWPYQWALNGTTGSHPSNLEWFESLLRHRFGKEWRTPDKIWDCTIDIVYPRSREVISRALAPKFNRDGQYIDDGPIYSDCAFGFTRYILNHKNTDWHGSRQGLLPGILSKASRSKELAAFVQDSLLQVPRKFLTNEHLFGDVYFTFVDQTELFIATCIYLSECGVPYISSHQHKDTFVEGEWVCGICELFHGHAPELTDIELSVDPAARPAPGAEALIRHGEDLQILPGGAVGRLILAVLFIWLQRLRLLFAGLTRRMFLVFLVT